MNIYKNDSTTQLLSLMRIMSKDKKALLRDGFTEAANQNQQIIDAVIAELKNRKVA